MEKKKKTPAHSPPDMCKVKNKPLANKPNEAPIKFSGLVAWKVKSMNMHNT